MLRSVCLYSGGAPPRTSLFWATRAGRELEPLPRPLGSPAYGKERGWCGPPEGGREKADPSCPTVEKVTVGWDGGGLWVRSTPTVGLEMGGLLPKGLLLMLLGVDVRRKLPAKAS